MTQLETFVQLNLASSTVGRPSSNKGISGCTDRHRS